MNRISSPAFMIRLYVCRVLPPVLSCPEFCCNIKARFDVIIKVAAEGEAGSQAKIKAKGNKPKLLTA